MSRDYGDIEAVIHGKAAVIKEVPVVMQKCGDSESDKGFAQLLHEIANTLEVQTKAFEEKTADEPVTIKWSDFVEFGANEVLGAMNSIAETYPEVELAIKAKIANSGSDSKVVYNYYSAVGSPTILAKKPKEGEYVWFLDYAQCNVEFPQVDWIPWVLTYTDISEIVFQDKIFVLTGFGHEEEKLIEEEITARGGMVKSSTVLKTNYLIVHKDAKTQTTKYKRARELNAQGKNIAIISSETFSQLSDITVDEDTEGAIYVLIHDKVAELRRVYEEIGYSEYVYEGVVDNWEEWQAIESSMGEAVKALQNEPEDKVVVVECSIETEKDVQMLMAIDEMASEYPELEMIIIDRINEGFDDYIYYSPAGQATILPDGVKQYHDPKLYDNGLPDADWIPAAWKEDYE